MFEKFFEFPIDSILGASAIYVFWQLRSRLDGVERAVLFGLIWGCGPRVFSYSLLDEIVISLIAAYILIFRRDKLRAFAGRCDETKYSGCRPSSSFLALHTLFSLVVLEDPRMMKWLVVFVSAPSSFGLCHGGYLDRMIDGPPVGFVMSHLYIYFGAYILQGLAGEIYFGEWGRFQTQDLYWQGSSLAVMPVMLFLQPIIFYLKQFMHEWKKTLYLGALLAFCAFFYDSRILQPLLVCCPVAGLIIYAKGYRHWIAIFASFLVAFVGNVYFDNYDVSPHLYVKRLKANLGYDREEIRSANKVSSVRFCIEYVKISSDDLFWECEIKSNMSASESTSNKLVSAFYQKEIQRPDRTIFETVITTRVMGKPKKGNYEALKFGAASLSSSVNLIHPLQNDFDRSLQLIAGIEATLESPNTLVQYLGPGSTPIGIP